jgi:uncharacterized protein (TIGR02600 family)
MKMLNQIRESLSGDRRQRGLALITVLSTLAILVVLTVATLSLSTMERRSSVKYADGENASTLADMAISLVMGQIWDGTRQERTNPTIWASQPGAIHKFSANGALLSAYKLYSDDKMVETSGRDLATDTPATDWAGNQAVWTDLNEPVIRPDSPNDSDNELEVIFPIIDPRAYISNLDGQDRSPNIEGFRYSAAFPGVREAGSVTDIDARLPMPVRWLYVLKDGTVGHVGDDGRFVAAGTGVGATEANPIVGRVAFWTDDETCKININTSGEPTVWGPPVVYHDRDYNWAISPPTRHEYQRYPGHPATVAMSSVLFPNQDLEIYGKAKTAQQQVMSIKERIYEIMPKINKGGSMGGTVPFWALTDPRYTGTRMFNTDVSNSIQQRLYASVDELLFSEEVNGSVRRTHDQSGSLRLFSDFTNEERALERVRFFLTAKSRAPETNMFGRPRVAIWPVADERLGEQHRTVYDRMIAYCSTINPQTKGSANSYFFRRYDSTSPTNDYAQIQRNQQLLEYLHRQMSEGFPSGGSAAASFTSKYGGGDSAQILAQIFDYIRSTNVYDGILAPVRAEVLTKYSLVDPSAPNSRILPNDEIIKLRNRVESERRTYTPVRASTQRNVDPEDGPVDPEQIPNRGLPGHGQVVPIETSIAGGSQRGFGRFPTISEVGFHFICTADGAVDRNEETTDNWMTFGEDGNVVMDLATGQPAITGGRTARRLEALTAMQRSASAQLDDPDFTYFMRGNMAEYPEVEARLATRQFPRVWYSNYPPEPTPGRYGTLNAAELAVSGNANHPRHPKFHPGYYPENWNATLPVDRPLAATERQVQAMLDLELTVVGTAFKGIFPDFAMDIQGLNTVQISGRDGAPVPLFNVSSAAAVPWRPQNALFLTTNSREAGGSIGPTGMASGRSVLGQAAFPPDPGYEPDVNSSNDFRGSRNFDLVGRYLTLPVEGNQPTMQFRGGTIRINIYASRNMVPQNIVQTIEVRFPAATLPVPELVVTSSPRIVWRNQTTQRDQFQLACEAPRWWSFSSGGALRRWKKAEDGNIDVTDSDDWWDPRRPPPQPPWTPGYSRPNNNGNFTNAERRTLGRFYIRGDNGAGDDTTPIPLLNTLIYAGGEPDTEPWRMPGAPLGSAPRLNHRFLAPGTTGPFGYDTLFSMVPRHGDIRLLAAKKVVGTDVWVPHPNVGKTPTPEQPDRGYNGHSFTRYEAAEAGASIGADRNRNNQLVAGAPYNAARYHDLPDTTQSMDSGMPNASVAKRYGDFDTGLGVLRDGAWINRADEGNTGVDNVKSDIEEEGMIRRPTAYYDEEQRGGDSADGYMTPNRMMPSPVVFGSLPTAVNANEPWRTLLFRPFVPPPNGSRAHPGSPNYGGSDPAFSGVNPADHYLLDLFWMPTVEPYAISEPFSTAGKINLNYQMVPFNSYITRATGIHAVMKGEIMHAVPSYDVRNIHVSPPNRRNVRVGEDYGVYYQLAKWTDVESRSVNEFYNPGNAPRLKYWHRKIEMDKRSSGAGAGSFPTATLGQFDARFEYRSTVPEGAQGLFRTASQICEVHLVPKKQAGASPAATAIAGVAVKATDGSDASAGQAYDWRNMSEFWDPRAVTGDNLRERPYASIYGKVTTKSNTFRVHFRAQSIRKARSVAPDQFQVGADTIASDYRGSALIERRIDPEDPRLKDYATDPSAESLENFYSFRVLERKRFNP